MRPEEKQALQAATIFEPVAGGLRSVEKRLKDMASPASPFVSELLSHVLSSEGKMMRPAITLLAANFHPHETDNPNVTIIWVYESFKTAKAQTEPDTAPASS